MENLDEKKLVFERYRLILLHEYIRDGKQSQIESPIEVTYTVDRDVYSRTPIIIEEMIERLKIFMLERLKEWTTR